jgi:hypothetical protein
VDELVQMDAKVFAQDTQQGSSISPFRITARKVVAAAWTAVSVVEDSVAWIIRKMHQQLGALLVVACCVVTPAKLLSGCFQATKHVFFLITSWRMAHRTPIQVAITHALLDAAYAQFMAM